MPKWTHDCKKCNYIGTIGDVDFYFHNVPNTSSFDVVLRTGEEVHDYAAKRTTMLEIEEYFSHNSISVSSLSHNQKVVDWALANLSCAFMNTMRRI